MDTEIHTVPTAEEAANTYLEESGLNLYSRDGEPSLNIKADMNNRKNWDNTPSYKLTIDASEYDRVALPDDAHSMLARNGGVLYHQHADDLFDYGPVTFVVDIELPGFED